MSYPQYPSEQPRPQQTYPPQQSWQGGEPPLWAPYYGAPFAAAVKRFFKKYATFSGRASRSEYWWWGLVSGVIGIVINIMVGAGSAATMATSRYATASAPSAGAMVGIIVLVILALATLVPSLAVTVRRLHDGNFSGWLLLLGLVPFLGGLALLVMMILPPNPAGQRFDQPYQV